jgi:hypothetical protein
MRRGLVEPGDWNEESPSLAQEENIALNDDH